MCISLVANDIGIFSCCIRHLHVLFVFIVFALFLIRLPWFFYCVCDFLFFKLLSFESFRY